MSEAILMDVQDGVAVITFNQPDSLNTFTASMMDGLGDAYQRCDADDAIRVVADFAAAHVLPRVMGLHKKMLWQSQDMSLSRLIELETKTLHHSMHLPDAVEGGMAYIEKRAPQWQTSVSEDWPDNLD